MGGRWREEAPGWHPDLTQTKPNLLIMLVEWNANPRTPLASGRAFVGRSAGTGRRVPHP